MRKLLSLLFILCILGAWGSIAYQNITVPNEYEANYAKAKEAYGSRYYVEALSWLDMAEKIENNYDTDRLRRDICHDMGDTESYIRQCVNMIHAYPEDVDNYIAVLDYYRENEDYRSLLKALQIYREQFPDQERIESLWEELSRMCEYIQTGYFDVQYATDSLMKVRFTEYAAGEEEQRIEYALTDDEGRKIFDYGHQDIAVSQDGSSALVCDQNGKWMRVNASNQLLAENAQVQFEKIGSLSTLGIATAVIDGKYRFVNGELLIAAPEWEDAVTFSEGIGAVCRNGRWAVVNGENWGDVTEYPYLDVAKNRYDLCFAGGRIVAADEKGYFLMDGECNPVTEKRYETIKAFEDEEPTAYLESGLWGFLDVTGECVIEPQYEDAQPFVNGYAAVKKNGLWGYIDRQGQIIVEPRFAECLPVRTNGMAYVRGEEGYWDYIIFYMLYYQS